MDVWVSEFEMAIVWPLVVQLGNNTWIHWRSEIAATGDRCCPLFKAAQRQLAKEKRKYEEAC